MRKLSDFLILAAIWAMGCIAMGFIAKITWRVASIGWDLLP